MSYELGRRVRGYAEADPYVCRGMGTRFGSGLCDTNEKVGCRVVVCESQTAVGATQTMVGSFPFRGLGGVSRRRTSFGSVMPVLVPFLLLFLSLAYSASGQQFRARVDQYTINLGDYFNLEYSIDADGENFRPPVFQGIDILSGPNTGSSVQYINGRLSQSETYGFVLRPRQAGRLHIPPAHIRVNGKELASNALDIQVLPSQGGAPNANAPQQSLPDNGAGSADMFVTVSANKTEVVQGEGIEVTYKVYLRNVEVEQYTTTKGPAFTGFWIEDQPIPNRVAPQPEQYNGKTYQAAVVRKVILFPQRTGDLTIDPYQVMVTGRTAGGGAPSFNWNDIFNGRMPDFFQDMGQPFQKQLSSKSLKVHVNPLPPGKPADFSGLVGNASLSSSVDQTKVKANEPVTYTLKLYGEGELSLVQPPKLPLPADAEVYEPKITDNLDRSGSNLKGIRQFDYTIVPRKEGKLEIPAVPLSYYDPQKKQYVTTQTAPVLIQVEKPEPLGKGNDIPSVRAPEKPENRHMPLWVLLAGIPIILALLAALAWKRRKTKAVTPPPLGVDELKREPTVHYLDAAMKANQAGLHAEFYDALQEACYAFLVQEAGMQQADISRESIRTSLQAKGWDEIKISRFLALLDKCEMAKYAPVGAGGFDHEEMLREAKEVMSGDL